MLSRLIPSSAPAVPAANCANDRSSLCARQQIGLPERAGQKIIRQRQLADLGVQRLHVNRRLARFRCLVRTKHSGRALRNWLRHVVIWFGCTSNCCANSVSVFSPFTAASATSALKARCGSGGGVCSSLLLSRNHTGHQAENPLISMASSARPPLSLAPGPYGYDNV